jgi:hypothetical protein
LLHADRQMDRHGTASRHIFASFILWTCQKWIIHRLIGFIFFVFI